MDKIREGLRALRGSRWGESCPDGQQPVPAASRCAAADCDTVRLTALACGERATVTCLEDPGTGGATKLAAMGVLPGVRLRLIQRYPAFVFRVGYSEFAVDISLAEGIRVRRGDGMEH